MYLESFKLSRLPFRLRPDPEFLYLSEHAALLLDALRSTLRTAQGPLALIAGPGLGKTTILHVLAREFQDSRPLARLQLPSLTRQELIESLATQFGVAVDAESLRGTTNALAQFFAAEAKRGRTAIILVDAAHELPDDALAQLLDLCAGRQAPVVVLAGEPALLKHVKAVWSTGAAALRRFQLKPLSLAETQAYVEYRLKVAGGTGAPAFEADAYAELQRYTGGTPGMINVACDRALALAEAHSNARVTSGDVRDAAHELQWVEFSAAAEDAQDAPQEPQAAPDLLLSIEITLRNRPVFSCVLRPGILTIGRDADNDLCLDSNIISRHHCRIVTTPEKSIIEDLGSTNGIVIHGKRIRLFRLMPADTVTIGEYRLTCQNAG